MRVVVEAVITLLEALAVLEVEALAQVVLMRVVPVQLTEAAAAVAMATPALTAAQAAQVLSLFHTQAQHNYLVVELLPNQAVTSFTHSRLLAHLALCHL
jgi:hypothetical protein